MSAMNADRDNAESRLRRKLLGELGDEVRGALEDSGVTEVQLNPDGTLWTDGKEGHRQIGEMTPSRAGLVAATCAGALGHVINYNSPMLEGELSILNGERLTVLIPPLVTAATFTMRKHASSRMTLEDWESSGGLSKEQRLDLESALVERLNIVVSGSTGSGKTTFANALVAALERLMPDERVVVIEDTRELQLSLANVCALRTSEKVDMGQLLRKALRLTPDRIIVGEVRGPEALTMLEAWNTGHPGGIATIHADSATKARVRIEQMCASAPNRSERQIRDSVDAGVDAVVQLVREKSGLRKVVEILRGTGGDSDGG